MYYVIQNTTYEPVKIKPVRLFLFVNVLVILTFTINTMPHMLRSYLQRFNDKLFLYYIIMYEFHGSFLILITSYLSIEC